MVYECMCYRSKLILGYSVFKLVYFFQTRSICLNLAQFFFKTRSIISFNLDHFGAGEKHRSQVIACQYRKHPKHSLMLTLGLKTFVSV